MVPMQIMDGMDAETDGTIFLGIDGGASRCRARLCNQRGRILGEAESGPASLSDGTEAVRSAVLRAALRALDSAGLARDDLTRCHAGLGLAGAGLPGAEERFFAGWAPFASARLVSDAHIAWLGAWGGGDGAVVALGTGSVGYGRAGARRWVLGGWGPQVSDEASGGAIGREAVRRAIWAWDGRARMTPLARHLLSALGETPDRISVVLQEAQPADWASWAPMVFRYAAEGDTAAAAILADAAQHVERMVACFCSLGFVRIALTGGIAAPMMAWLAAKTRQKLSVPQGDALAGAVHLARQAGD